MELELMVLGGDARLFSSRVFSSPPVTHDASCYLGIRDLRALRTLAAVFKVTLGVQKASPLPPVVSEGGGGGFGFFF